jgi:hypothetical protein
MPTIIVTHDVTDTDRWLSSPKREEILPSLGASNIRTFVSPQDRTKVGLVVDITDLDVLFAALEDPIRVEPVDAPVLEAQAMGVPLLHAHCGVPRGDATRLVERGGVHVDAQHPPARSDLVGECSQVGARAAPQIHDEGALLDGKLLEHERLVRPPEVGCRQPGQVVIGPI